MCPFRNPSDPKRAPTPPEPGSPTTPLVHEKQKTERPRSKVEFNLNTTAPSGRHSSSPSSDDESTPASPLLDAVVEDATDGPVAPTRGPVPPTRGPVPRVGMTGTSKNGALSTQEDSTVEPLKKDHKLSIARLKQLGSSYVSRSAASEASDRTEGRWRKVSAGVPFAAQRPRSEPMMRRMKSFPPTTRLRLNVSESSVLPPDCLNKEGKMEGLSKRYGSTGRALKKYYKGQSQLIEGYKQDAEQVERDPVEVKELAKKDSKRDSILARVTLALNMILLIAKVVAAAFSGSYAVISSVVDSAVDIASGLVIWVTGRAIKRRDPYLYPRGRTRLEPLAVVIVSVIMGVASVQMIGKSVEAIVRKEVDPVIGPVTLGIMISTILTKFALAIACYVIHSAQSMVLFQDHRNDCVSNAVAIACGFIGAHYWKWADPIGAILVSVYIVITWAITGNEQIRILTGMSASPDLINRIIKLCLEHDARVQLIDTVLAYHFGTRYLVEVHVVMDPHMTLKEAHDVAEPLQNKLELLEFVERAFVHIDYETDHDPGQEHKTV